MSDDQIDQKLDALDSKIEALKKQKRRLRAQAKKKERAQDTRRKVLLGALLIRDMKRSEKVREHFQKQLHDFLERDVDKELFDDAWWASLMSDSD